MNSLPERPSAAAFMQASLQALQEECPQAYQLICSQLAGRDLVIEIESEPVFLSFQADQIRFLPADQAPPSTRLRLSTSWQTILDLVDARLTILEAVKEARLDLTGTSSELILLYDAILTYLRGGVRTLTFPLLLQELRKNFEPRLLEMRY